MVPKAHQILQEHHLQRILNHLLLIDLLIQALVAAAALDELGAVDDTSKVEADVDVVSELLEHEHLVEEIAGERHNSSDDEWVLRIELGLVIGCGYNFLFLQDLQPVVVDLLEDGKLVLDKDRLVLLLS